MNQKIAKKLRQGIKRQQGGMVRNVYDHIMAKRPRLIPKFIWNAVIVWLLK